MTEPVEVPDEQEEEAPAAPSEPAAEPTPEEEEAAEQEELAEAPEEPAEPQEPPQGQQGVGDKEIETAYKRVGRAADTYMRKVGEAMGEAATALNPCPRCSGQILGFIFDPMMNPPDADTKDATLASIGEAPALATEPDPYSRQCDVCKGSGSTLSGSRINKQKALRCVPCKGQGWIAVGDERRLPQFTNEVVVPDGAPAVAANGASEVPQQTPDTDIWGRHSTDPDYGVHPMYVGAR